MTLTPYLGAKRSLGTLHQIIGHMPPHECSIETHLGTGAVINAKPPSARDIGIEIDQDTIATFDYAAHAEVINTDCHRYLTEFDFSQWRRVFIYGDPPYLDSTRTSSHKYRFDYTRAQHVEFLRILKGLPANVSVMLSGYPSGLYDDELDGWRTHEFQAMTRGGVRTEKLWMNYPPPEPFWHTQAGEDAEDRRRIKRLVGRWRKNFHKRGMLEQIAILAALANPEDD